MRVQVIRHPAVRALVATALVAMVALSPAAAAPSAKRTKKTSAQLRHDLASMRARIHEARLQIHETKKQEGRITDQIDEVEDRLLRTEGSLSRAKSRLRVLNRQQKVLNERIDETRQRLAARRSILSRRIRDNYELGKTSYAQVLLRSRSVHEYLSRSYYVERIVDSDVKLVDGIKADQRQLEADERELAAELSEQQALRARLEVESAQYRADVDRKRELLENVQDKREDQEAALDQLEESSRSIEARIRALQQTPRGRKRLLHAWSGSFMRPTGGPITSGFGMRYHPILHRTRMHTGVDIGAGYGTSIHAAASGEVIMAGYMRGYGYTVIVDHGGGVSTLYGHCSALLVGEGQTVSRGQVIARVGSTGLATGPHLHFEVRRNGTPVNPF